MTEEKRGHRHNAKITFDDNNVKQGLKILLFSGVGGDVLVTGERLFVVDAADLERLEKAGVEYIVVE